MKREQFVQLLKEQFLLLDGGYGTEFIKRGYGQLPGVALNLQAPEAVESLQRAYVEAGTDILLTNTFSANRPKLHLLGLEEHFEKINATAVQIARRAAGPDTWVFGNIASLGEFPKPIGTLDFEEAVAAFYEQGKILADEGVDGFTIETMTDIKELKAAVYAVRSISKELPVIVHMTFDSTFRTVTGTSPAIFAAILEDMDVDVIGMNCTLEPRDMIPVYKELVKYTTKYLSVEPNAGDPYFDGTYLQYKMTPEHFAMYMEDYVDFGVNIFGGCCGTTPEHIKVMKRLLSKRKPLQKIDNFVQALTSRTIYRPIEPFAIIGERINPASRKEFQEEINQKKWHSLLKEASLQEKEGATVLDVNLGIEKVLTPEHFREMTIALDRHSSLPLSFDIQSSELLEVALREYPGRPLINSAWLNPKIMEERIELLKKYGGMLVLLGMGKEVPENPEKRMKYILDGIQMLEEHGISRQRVLADPLVLSIGAKKDPKVALDAIRMLTEAGIKTTMGLSNLSYGLPNRSQLNGAYVAQAVEKGLSTAIMNPGDQLVMNCLQGALTLEGKTVEEDELEKIDNPVVDALLIGDGIELKRLVDERLKDTTPREVAEKFLGVAMEEIGSLYTAGEVYLPHLLLASEVVQPIFEYVNSLTTEGRTYRGKVVLATVEGDVHDIGRKIVGTVLQTGGFEVIDIGKDCPAEKVIEAVKQEQPEIVGLSAMMTTTVGGVEKVAELLKQENLHVHLIVGGASMNADLGDKFGCAGYAQNASQALELCKRFVEQG